MVDVSNIFYPTLTLLYCFPPLQGGTKGGSNVMKITEYHFSNILLIIGEISDSRLLTSNHHLFRGLNKEVGDLTHDLMMGFK
ncbi:MAG: hypothetical protein AN482_19255 [Anabaena sp. LE011-02]|nr:MAG: hypothetical protein AN482_19255 [Anabaena sp. LE011-02]